MISTEERSHPAYPQASWCHYNRYEVIDGYFRLKPRSVLVVQSLLEDPKEEARVFGAAILGLKSPDECLVRYVGTRFTPNLGRRRAL